MIKKFLDKEDVLPVFPLSGTLLLPGGYLPLNIFEPRYINMVDDALKSGRIIGMVQPCAKADKGELYKTGCLGRITSFHETEDNRYLVTLTGTTRFDIVKEEKPKNGYRMMQVSTARYSHDIKHDEQPVDINWGCILEKLESYFAIKGIDCDMTILEHTPKAKLLSVLSMVCPFDASEKQALLEAENCKIRFDLFTKIIDIATQCGQDEKKKVEH